MSAFDSSVNLTSFRDCEDRVIPRKVMGKVLEAGRNSPSPGNVNTLEFIVIENDDKLETLSDALGDKRVKKAPSSVAVIVDVDRARRRFGENVADNIIYSESACAVQNMRLVGQENDLSSVWLSGFDELMVSEIMNVPDGKKIVSLVSFGFTDNPVPLEQKFGMNEICYYDDYGDQINSVFDGFEWKGIREERRVYGKKGKGLISKVKALFE